MNPDMLEGMEKEKMSEVMTEEEYLGSLKKHPDLAGRVYNMTQELADKTLIENPQTFSFLPSIYLKPELCESILRASIESETTPSSPIPGQNGGKFQEVKGGLKGWRFREFVEKISKETWEEISLEIREGVANKESRLAPKIPGLSYDFWMSMSEPVKRNGLRRWNINSLKDIPEEHRTEELLQAFVSLLPSLIREVPKDILTEKFLQDAIRSNPAVFGYVPFEKIDKNLTVFALKKGASIKGTLPTTIWDSEIAKSALTNSSNLTKIPPDYMDNEEMWWLYIQGGGSILNVPKKYQTESLCFDFISSVIDERKKDRKDREEVDPSPISIHYKVSNHPEIADLQDFQIKTAKNYGYDGVMVLIHTIHAKISKTAWKEITTIIPKAIPNVPIEWQTSEMIDRALVACKTPDEVNLLSGSLNLKKLIKEHIPLLVGCQRLEAVSEDILKNGGIEERKIPEGTILIERYGSSIGGVESESAGVMQPMTTGSST